MGVGGMVVESWTPELSFPEPDLPGLPAMWLLIPPPALSPGNPFFFLCLTCPGDDGLGRKLQS